MTDQHPITPPPELVAKWTGSTRGYYEAVRWGADQELEACCEWVRNTPFIDLDGHDALRNARRPTPQPVAQEEDCPGCEGTPVASNSPCAVCGRAVLARWGNSQAILDSSPTTPIN